MRNYLWNVKVVTRNCSTSFKSCFFSLGKTKMMRKCSICVPNWSWLTSDLFASFDEAACVLARRSSVKMLTGTWFISSPLCFVPGPPTLTLVFIQGGGIYMSPNQSQLLGEAAWFWVFHVWKDVCDQNEISFHIWSGQLSNYYGIWRRRWRDHSV